MKPFLFLLFFVLAYSAAHAATNNTKACKEKGEQQSVTRGFTLLQLARKAVVVATAQKEKDLPELPVGFSIYRF